MTSCRKTGTHIEYWLGERRKRHVHEINHSTQHILQCPLYKPDKDIHNVRGGKVCSTKSYGCMGNLTLDVASARHRVDQARPCMFMDACHRSILVRNTELRTQVDPASMLMCRRSLKQ